MAKLVGPLLSIGASGQIAKSMVFSKWHGIKYARRYVIPANPNTTGQQKTRQVFTNIDATWKYLQTLARAPWTAAVKGRPMVARNMLMKINIPKIIDQTDMADFVASPGNGGGLAPASATFAATATAGEIKCTITPPATPVDWTLEKSVAMAFPNRAPTELPTVQDVEDSASATPWGITLTGLTSSTEYVVAAWLEWTRADGTTVYGASITGTATPA